MYMCYTSNLISFNSCFKPFDRWAVESTEEGSTTAVVTSMGIISLMIHNDIRVDITMDGAIRILNFAVSPNFLPMTT